MKFEEWDVSAMEPYSEYGDETKEAHDEEIRHLRASYCLGQEPATGVRDTSITFSLDGE